jgi:phosphoserine aminotransferase
MSRVYNFSAGPSMLPLKVLEIAAAEMTDYRGCGQSVMEMSHRSPVYEQIIAETEVLVRSTLNVPDNYKVLFLQGGASMQFSAVPLNLMNGSGKADYVLSGQFSTKAYEEAKRYGDVKVLASSKDKNFSYIPEFQVSDIRPDADYVHICYNNTIFGSRFPKIPDTGNIPLVADLSSCIMSEPIDISRFALVYAGAQKNMAPAGLTIVIVREDMIGHERYRSART